MILICLLEQPTLRLFGIFIYIASVLLLIYVKIDGYSLEAYTGADSWVLLPFIGSFQPSELAKPGLAIVSSMIFERMTANETSYLRGSVQLALLFGIPLILIMREPDFGTAMVIVFMFLCVLFAWGLKWRYILGGIVSAIIILPLVWVFYLDTYQQIVS